MRSKTRTTTRQESADFRFEEEDMFDLESLSDEELEDFLFEEDEKPKGMFNLPSLAGLSLIMVGVAYIFQQAGMWSGFDLSILAAMLPWIAGVLIILLGFGVLNWRPDRKKKSTKKKAAKAPKSKARVVVEKTTARTPHTGKRKLEKSRNKKIFGVCAGIAEYFGIDPTLVRIAFVIGTIATQGPFLLAYLILAAVMPHPKGPTVEERITILKDTNS
jgi:phage shock protein C